MSEHKRSEQVPIAPEKGWRLESFRGYMAADSGPDGDLVGLLDVLAWYAKAKRIPPVMAADEMAKVITAGVMGDVFRCCHGDYAKPLESTEHFGFVSDKGYSKLAALFTQPCPDDDSAFRSVNVELPVCGQSMMLRSWAEFQAFCNPWGSVQGDFRPPGVKPLAPALGLALRWDATRQDGDFQRCQHVAIRLSRAHELWGYGRAEQVKGARPGANTGSTSEMDALYRRLSDDMRATVDQLIAERPKREGGTRRAKVTDWQRCAMADIVQAVERIEVGRGSSFLADRLDMSRQAVASHIKTDGVARSRGKLAGLGGEKPRLAASK